MKQTLFRSGLAACAVGALGVAALGLGGCAGPLERASSPGGSGGWGGGREQWDGGAGSWSLVMNSPRTERALAGVDVSALPEYSRNDDALGYRVDGPLLASDEWPQREQPDLYYARRIQLETRASEVLYFDTEARYRGGYGPRSGNGVYGNGTWGFWR